MLTQNLGFPRIDRCLCKDCILELIEQIKERQAFL